MPLPPLGPFDKRTIDKCFDIMEDINRNPDLSRIENIEANALALYKKAGFKFYEKCREYILPREQAAFLRGEKLKHKRNLRNFFIKNCSAVFRDYKPSDKREVLGLYAAWMKERVASHNDAFYRAMMADSFKVFGQMLECFKALKITAKVVEIDKRIRAFSSGFGLNKDMFCVNFEIADLKLKGLSTFIFSEFAKALENCHEINIMDDSGIDTIRDTKEMWHPSRLVPSYTVLKKIGI